MSLDEEPQLNLPNYELQSSRSRIKAVAFYARKVFGETEQEGLRRYLSEEGKKLAVEVVMELEKLQKNSTIGIVDLDDRSRRGQNEEDSDDRSDTQKLIDLCKDYAKDIQSNLDTLNGKPESGAEDAGGVLGAASGN